MADIAIFPTCCCCEHAKNVDNTGRLQQKYSKFEFDILTRIEEIVKH